MICEITGAHKKCISHNIVPCADIDNKTEKILGCPLKEYEPFILTISEDVYKARYRGTIQKRFVQKVYDKHGKDELIKLMKVIDELKCEKTLIRMFAFGILIKNHGIYYPLPVSTESWGHMTAEEYNRHRRRVSVLIAFKKKTGLSWRNINKALGKYMTGYPNDHNFLHKDEIWHDVKSRLENYERKNNV
jgi:hypothetical protein